MSRKSILTIIGTLLTAFVLCALPPALPQAGAQRKSETTVLPFSAAPYQVGERLSYNISFSNFSTAAHVELMIVGRGTFFDREGVQLQAHVETVDVVGAALYSINSDYISYVDSTKGMPFRTLQVPREATTSPGGRSPEETPTTGRDDNQLGAPASNLSTQTTVDAFPGSYDLLSALHRARALPLAQGANYRLAVRHEAEQYDVELKVTGREAVKTNISTFNAIATRLRVLGTQRAFDYPIHIYFSDDERHVPVLLTARHPAGEIRAELVSSTFSNEAPASPPASAPPATLPDPPQPPPPVAAPPTDPKLRSALPADLPFDIGEQLNFNVFLLSAPQPVGTISYQVRPRAKYHGRDGLLLTAAAQTTAAAQRLFKVDDLINSYVDPATLLPFRTELRIEEGRRRSNRILTVDQERGAAVADNGTRTGIPVGTHDLISALYALRCFDLSPPRRNAVTLLTGNRPRVLTITSLRRENIELNGQQISALQLSLTTDDQQPDKYALRLWVSGDRRRLPLRLTAVTPLGPLRADLAIIPVSRQ